MHIWTKFDILTARLMLYALALAAGLTPPSVSAQSNSGNFDLSVSTRAVSDGCFAGDTCTFAVAITNFGPDRFGGAVRLRGRFEGRIRATLSGIGPAGWTCNQRSRDTVCSYRAGGLRPGRTIVLETAYELPSGRPVGDLTYCAGIEWEGTRGGEPSVADIQRALAERGYNPGPADGVPGYGTRSAIERFQYDNGLPVTGWPTPEFNERLFSGVGYAGDIQPGNDRSCAGTGEPAMAPVRITPDEPENEELPPEDAAPPADLDRRSTGRDAVQPRQDAAPDQAAPLPRVRTPAPAPEEPAQTQDDDARSSEQPESLVPIHGKQTSEFHRKQLSTQHEKATSGAVVESQPLAPITDTAPTDNGLADFHLKYKSVQHRKGSSTLLEVHTKAISRVVHSKARSVITNPQFQGDTHDKALSEFHKKYRSQSHDTTTSQAGGSQ